uniref:Uncharacterized protein n=1 Tax=Sphaeramia orbicularis TaxID=375764 RepID=A0A672Z043_9TELE
LDAIKNVHTISRLSVGSDQIPQDRIMTLVSSMRRRCTACLEARGGPSP